MYEDTVRRYAIEVVRTQYAIFEIEAEFEADAIDSAYSMIQKLKEDDWEDNDTIVQILWEEFIDEA